ncbi:hypothetical protein Salat_1183200 [Sesamum alatum]|uniref:Uncharacterized protein n=1 Tax=Sesamum alatum TaxID=300844 RepID=A0AAE1YFW6_9LAMI|nr:hypothetical protein Salat_1183200 [Sesamum alatum]
MRCPEGQSGVSRSLDYKPLSREDQRCYPCGGLSARTSDEYAIPGGLPIFKGDSWNVILKLEGIDTDFGTNGSSVSGESNGEHQVHNTRSYGHLELILDNLNYHEEMKHTYPLYGTLM